MVYYVCFYWISSQFVCIENAIYLSENVQDGDDAGYGALLRLKKTTILKWFYRLKKHNYTYFKGLIGSVGSASPFESFNVDKTVFKGRFPVEVNI